MQGNKLNFFVVGITLIATITPGLTSAKPIGDIDPIFYCTLSQPADPNAPLDPAEVRANILCLSHKTNALKNWIGAVVEFLQQPEITSKLERLPDQPVKLCKYTIRACNEQEKPITQEGWKSPEVGTIQKFLKEEGSFTYPEITNYFGPITETAVKTFQSKQGLTPTGVVDKITLEKMQALASQMAPSAASSIRQLSSQPAP